MTPQDAPKDAPGDPHSSEQDTDPQPSGQRSPAHPVARADAPSWFGYIGLGIALASLLIGVAGMVLAVFWFIGWTRS